MSEKLSPQQSVSLARSLTHFQSDLTDYELLHYAALDDSQRLQMENTLTRLASAAGQLYACSVQLQFEAVLPGIKKLQDAAGSLKKFLQTVQQIRQVLDIVSILAGLADAVLNADAESVISGADQIIGIIRKA